MGKMFSVAGALSNRKQKMIIVLAGGLTNRQH
jgi:hypothetical protein